MTKYLDNYNTYHNTTNMRLQVQTDPPAGVLENQVRNTNGELGGSFYSTPLAGQSMLGGGGNLTFSSNAAGAAYFYTSKMPVTPGEYVSARWTCNGSTNSAGLSPITNLVTNPSFETNTTGYSAGSGTSSIARMTGNGAFGTACLQVTPPVNQNARSYVNGPTLAVVAGTTYTVTNSYQYFFGSAGGGVLLRWYSDTAATVQIGADVVINYAAWSNVNSWFNRTANTTAPAGAVRVKTFPFVNAPGGNWLTGDYWLMDGFGFFNAASVSYFDGTTTDTTKYDYAWSGTAHASTSTATVIPLGYKGRIEWIDASGTVTQTTQTVLITSTSTTVWYTPTVVPAGAVYARVRWDFYNNLGNTPGYAFTWNFQNVMFTHAATSAALASGYAYSDPFYWNDILGPSKTVSVDREALQLGTLSLSIADADLDPSVSDALHPGRLIRWQTNIGGTWQNVYQGTLYQANVTNPIDWDKSVTTLVQDKPQIVLTAVDAVNDLGYTAENSMDIANLPYLLEGSPISWLINGSGNQSGPGTVRAVNANAKMIDQIALARDSQQGYAWVNKDNVLVVNESAYMNNTVKWTISTDAGSALSPVVDSVACDWDTSYAVNHVTVKWQHIVNGETVEEPLGPYTDPDSIKEFGTLTKEYTWFASTTTDVATKANAVLAAMSTPTYRVQSLTLAVQDAATFAFATGVELYDLVHVKYLDKFDGNLRVTGIKHDVSALKWYVTLTFSTDGGIASPQELPPVANASTWTDTMNALKVGGVLIQSGSVSTGSVTGTEWTGTATFPIPFSGTPRVVISGVSNGSPGIVWNAFSATATGFTWRSNWNDVSTHSNGGTASWIAIGPA